MSLGFVAVGPVLAIAPVLAACAALQTTADDAAQSRPRATSTHQPGPEFPVTSPGGKVDAASQQRADTWLAGALVPPGAVQSRTLPPGVASEETMGVWCTPMADAVGYWTLPSMSAGDTLGWLATHASRSMQVTSGGNIPASETESTAGGSVVDEPMPAPSLEAMIVTVTSIGNGTGIRADALARGTNSVCATAPSRNHARHRRLTIVRSPTGAATPVPPGRQFATTPID